MHFVDICAFLKMKAIIWLFVTACFALLISAPNVHAAQGIDMSQFICEKLSLQDWQCMVNNGKSFAIIQAWCGGYQYGNAVAQCVSNAWAAGMAHIDVYAFMCPNCNGNNPCASAVNTLLDRLSSDGVQYGQLWFDVEDCDGCWNDVASNVAFVKECVSAAQARGVTVGIYTSYYEWQTVTGMATDFDNLQLWYANNAVSLFLLSASVACARTFFVLFALSHRARVAGTRTTTATRASTTRGHTAWAAGATPP